MAVPAALATAAVAWAAPARTIELNATTTTASWDGSGIIGTPVADATTEDTHVKLGVGGNITVTTSEPGPTGQEDIDLYIYRGDAAGEPQGDPIAEGVNAGDESVSVKNLKPGDYVVRAFAWLGVDATYKGTIKLTPTAAADPAAPPAPGPAPAAPAPDQTPDAAITRLRSGKARSFKGLSGTAADDKGVAKVEVALVLKRGKQCTQLKGRRFVKLAKCGGPTAFNAAKGTTRWSFKTPKLKKGSYTAFARAVDSAGQVQGGFTRKNKKSFRLK